MLGVAGLLVGAILLPSRGTDPCKGGRDLVVMMPCVHLMDVAAVPRIRMREEAVPMQTEGHKTGAVYMAAAQNCKFLKCTSASQICAPSAAAQVPCRMLVLRANRGCIGTLHDAAFSVPNSFHTLFLV